MKARYLLAIGSVAAAMAISAKETPPCEVGEAWAFFLVRGAGRQDWVKRALVRHSFEPMGLRMAGSLGAAGATTTPFLIATDTLPCPVGSAPGCDRFGLRLVPPRGFGLGWASKGMVILTVNIVAEDSSGEYIVSDARFRALRGHEPVETPLLDAPVHYNWNQPAPLDGLIERAFLLSCPG